MKPIEQRIAEELGVRAAQVHAAIELLDAGSTVPFIARYRKEATGMLDDAQFARWTSVSRYLRELEERRTAILDPASANRASSTRRSKRDHASRFSKARLEDIYLPLSRNGAPRRRSPERPAWSRLRLALLADPTN